MSRMAFGVLLLLATAAPLPAQEADGVELLLLRLEQVLDTHDRAAFHALFVSPDSARRDQHDRDLFTPGATRTVVRERDRLPAQQDDVEGQLVVADIFSEAPGTGRLITAALELRPSPDDDGGPWRIHAVAGLTAIDGFFRLRLNLDDGFEARGLELRAEDLRLRLQDGTVFPVESDAGVTGLLFVGRGEMVFAPAPPSEQGQLRLFAGQERLVAPFDTAFVRLSPSDRTWEPATRIAARPDARQIRRAQQVFAREAPKSFTVGLDGLSEHTWHLLPPAGDILAEVETRRHGTLTYSRSAVQMEDVSLVHRERRLTIALYASAAKLATRGRFYSDAAMRAFHILDYDVDAALDPARERIGVSARLRIRVPDPALPHLSLRLADPLVVTSVASEEHGPLLHVRIPQQDTILVGLPRERARDAIVTLTMTYGGQIPSQDLGPEVLQIGPDAALAAGLRGTEPYYLLTGRSRWYPQAPVSAVATATLRIRLPTGYRGAATGEPVTLDTATLGEWLALASDDHTFIFRARRPVRYLAVVAGRFVRAGATTLSLEPAGDPDAPPAHVAITVDATAAQQARGRALLDPAEDIVRFYASLMGEVPYPSLAIVLLESHLPGGHSPGHIIAINEPVPQAFLTWRGDPVAFDRFPEYVLAHEIAHQWWGQAVGWKNYREQWISEGFAQYFAAMYAEATHEERVFADMLAQFRRSALSHSQAGPVHLGQRVGHIGGDSRVHRAIIYNKAAAVLHMLRRLVGDTVFIAGLRQFYGASAFGEAGSDDLRQVFEAASGLDLEQFFEGWIYGSDIPRVQYATSIEDGEVAVLFRQAGPQLFDLPMTVTLVYTDRRTEDVVVRVTGRETAHVIPASGFVRQIEINRDSGALVEISRIR